jgi:hypothetical protein
VLDRKLLARYHHVRRFTYEDDRGKYSYKRKSWSGMNPCLLNTY